jgi:alkylation response protein AidB-like acyl-CoA dehydrogenase
LFGVWAADKDGSRVAAERTPHGWRLSGVRVWCSGAGLLDAALVTADSTEGSILLLVDLDEPGVRPDPSTWATPALASTTTWTVHFDGVDVPADRQIARAGFYLGRPGFWHGSVGVAAAWAGGALGVADPLLGQRTTDPHRLVHAGVVHAAGWTMRAALRTAAAEIDADPSDRAGMGMIRALTVRHVIERAATEIIDRCGRALGPAPLATDADHAQRVADLTLYIRQHHAEHDLETVGRWIVDRPSTRRPAVGTPSPQTAR